MEIEKIVNLNDAELAHKERETAEQVFRIRFQMRMGQNEGLKKLREFKKDIARIKTVQRQRVLGVAAAPAGPLDEKPSALKKTLKKKTVKKKTAGKKAAAKKTAKSKAQSRAQSRTSGKAKTATKAKPRAAGRGKANAKKESHKRNDGK